jgi:hypothetical protein
MRDFTLDIYERLLQTFIKNTIPIYGVANWLEKKPQVGVMMRHDVDRRAENALAMAKLEARNGIKSTYYFRMTSGSFQPKIILEIANLGHEIGYHYEDLATAKGDMEKAIKSFAINLEKLRKIAPITTIAMHGSPLSPFDNREMWKNNDFKKFGIIAEALVSIDYNNIYYLTDSGRSWAENSANLRDHVPNSLVAHVGNTEQFCSFIEKNPNARYAISCHPERWDNSLLSWLVQYTKDFCINVIKIILLNIRR